MSEVTVRRLSAAEFHAEVHGLAELLADAVDSGASLGFLAPFDRDAAADWWLSRAEAVESGELLVWVVRAGGGAGSGRIVGTVSLVPESKPNGRHRAEISKLMVHREARGGGLARRLLATAEAEARRRGVTLMLLDTETDSPAEHLYRAAGWTRHGIVPAYAAGPRGELRDCSFYHLQLQ